MEDEIAKRVMELFAEQMGVDVAEIAPEMSLANDLNMDSLDAVEVVMQLEEEFHLSVRDEDVEEIKTVGDVIEYIRRRFDDGGAGVGARLKTPPKPPGQSGNKAEEGR